MPLDESQGIGYASGMESCLRSQPVLLAPLKLAAIDLDGTLLGGDHQISAENREAVEKLVAAGMEVVLASGRHHLSMQPYARQLPGVRWLVSAQGGEVSDVAREQVLERHFLTRAQLAEVIAMLRRREMSALFYAAEGILTDSPTNDSLAFYATLSGNEIHRVTTKELMERSVFKVVAAAAEADIDRLIASPEAIALELQRVRTHRRFFEFMPRGVTKASALATLAAHLGLEARNVVAFGDGDNDVPMFQWAGSSFAMPHGWPSAKEHARYVGPEGDPDSALARAVACILQQAWQRGLAG